MMEYCRHQGLRCLVMFPVCPVDVGVVAGSYSTLRTAKFRTTGTVPTNCVCTGRQLLL